MAGTSRTPGHAMPGKIPPGNVTRFDAACGASVISPHGIAQIHLLRTTVAARTRWRHRSPTAGTPRTAAHRRDGEAAGRAEPGDRGEAGRKIMNSTRCWPVFGLATAVLAACAPSRLPPDTPVARLSADVVAMKTFPAATISPGCAAALHELTSKVQDIKALQRQGKPVDAVSNDVLESDQDAAEEACHPDAVRMCRTPATPAAARACGGVAGMTPYPDRTGG
jgi:hypothetical protein